MEPPLLTFEVNLPVWSYRPKKGAREREGEEGREKDEGDGRFSHLIPLPQSSFHKVGFEVVVGGGKGKKKRGREGGEEGRGRCSPLPDRLYLVAV